jgi:hypothetical protein
MRVGDADIIDDDDSKMSGKPDEQKRSVAVRTFAVCAERIPVNRARTGKSDLRIRSLCDVYPES